MLKVTYTDTSLCVEYCPEPLELLLSDRVCMYARAQRPIAVQPLRASLLLAAAVADQRQLSQYAELEVTRSDRDWLEVTLAGLWITEAPEAEIGIFIAELNPHLEQRLWRLWQLSQQPQLQGAIARGARR